MSTTRKILLGTLLLAVALVGLGAAYYWNETRSHEFLGSSTDEFVAADNPADRAYRFGLKLPPSQPDAELAATPWPTYGRDVERTHAAPFDHRPPYRRVWMLRARHYVEFPPAVAYGKVYVPQQQGRFFALDAETGKIEWSKKFGRCNAASPTIWEGVIYHVLMQRRPCRRHQAGTNGLVIAMDAKTGRELWRFLAGGVESSPLVVDGVLYFGSWDHYVYALDARTGKVRWRYGTDDQVVAGPAYHAGTIYIPNSSGRLYALDAETGKLRWRAESFSRFGRREYFYATPTVAYGRVYLGNADGYLYSYGATTGRLLWAQRAGTYVYTAAAAWNKTIYVGTWDGYVVAFNAATGEERWRHDSPGGVTGAPTVMGGLLYFSTLGTFRPGAHSRRVEDGRNETFAVDAATGRAVWRFGDGAYSPVVADSERVYLVGRGRVYGLVEKRLRRLAG